MRLDAVKYLYEVDDLSLDEPLSDDPSVQDPNEYDYLKHIHTTDQPATFDVIKSWRTILDQYSGRHVHRSSYLMYLQKTKFRATFIM